MLVLHRIVQLKITKAVYLYLGHMKRQPPRGGKKSKTHKKEIKFKSMRNLIWV
jgi:hypothetical protein